MKNLFLCSMLIFWACATTLAQSLTWPATSPSPDTYGYTWETSEAPGGPTYDWVEIISNGLGTQVTGFGDDNAVGGIQMGITFQYYWTKKSEVCIGSNGFVTFGECISISSGATGFIPPPNSASPNDVIAPYLADLNFAGAGNPGVVYTYTDVANDRFIITYENVPYWVGAAPGGWSGSNTFQVILNAADSSITFQYQSMNGSWDPAYNAAPNPFVAGIENNSGTIGMAPVPSPTTTTDIPGDSTAIRFKAPATALIDVPDISIEGTNKGLSAFFIPWAPPATTGTPSFTFSVDVVNTGNTIISDPVEVIVEVTDSLNQSMFFIEDSISSGLNIGEAKTLNFSTPFYVANSGPHQLSARLKNPASLMDVNPDNDEIQVETVVVDTSASETVMGYVNKGLIALAGGGTGTGLSVGYFLEPPTYPANILALEFLAFNGGMFPLTDGAVVSIFAADSGSSVPGAMLYTDTIQAGDIIFTNWNRVELDSAIEITENGFFMSFTRIDPNLFLYIDPIPPFSRLSYEIQNNGQSWTADRNRETQDYWFQSIVSLATPIDTTQDTTNTSIDPGMSAFEKFNVYPNPNQGVFTLDLASSSVSDFDIRIFSMSGSKVYLNFVQKRSEWKADLDLSHLPAGVYMVQVRSDEGVETRKVSIR